MTPKQERFVSEYLIDLNATQAAVRAGYSAKTANAQGGRLLMDVSVRSAIEQAKAARAKRTEIDADWVLRRLHAETVADLADLYDDSGNLRPIGDWPTVWRTGLVASVETVQERDGSDAEGRPAYSAVRKVKLADRTRLLELIGKHVDIGAFRERIEVADVTDRAEQMRQRRERRLGRSSG